ncbi:putative serine/threonine-protein kinase [Hordeum vulgare]|nr:putative serine/threonine-protein kinase [Hordeum vulgare]
MVVPGTPAPRGIDLNMVPVGGGSSSGGARKRPRKLPTNAMGNAHNLFDKMSGTEDKANRIFMEIPIYECGGGGFGPNETQSQDGRNPFIARHDCIGYTFGYDNVGMSDSLIEDQIGMGNPFPLDHEFSEDYD